MTINAFRRPRKSDKIDPRRHPATLEIAHNEAGGGDNSDDVDDDNDEDVNTYDDDKHIHDASSKVKTRSGFFSFCSCETSRLL